MLEQKKIKINKEIYSKSVLLRTCYNFIDNYYLFLDSEEDKWVVSCKLKKDSSIKNIEELEGEFNNSLINEALRDSITENTKTIKELIVARALYGADSEITTFDQGQGDNINNEDFSFLEENDDDDYLDDPLGIAVPWEEKYGKNNENLNKEAKEIKKLIRKRKNKKVDFGRKSSI